MSSTSKTTITVVECRELKRALHKLGNKGQIDYFLKKGQGPSKKVNSRPKKVSKRMSV